MKITELLESSQIRDKITGKEYIITEAYNEENKFAIATEFDAVANEIVEGAPTIKIGKTDEVMPDDVCEDYCFKVVKFATDKAIPSADGLEVKDGKLLRNGNPVIKNQGSIVIEKILALREGRYILLTNKGEEKEIMAYEPFRDRFIVLLSHLEDDLFLLGESEGIALYGYNHYETDKRYEKDGTEVIETIFNHAGLVAINTCAYHDSYVCSELTEEKAFVYKEEREFGFTHFVVKVKNSDEVLNVKTAEDGGLSYKKRVAPGKVEVASTYGDDIILFGDEFISFTNGVLIKRNATKFHEFRFLIDVYDENRNTIYVFADAKHHTKTLICMHTNDRGDIFTISE